MNKTQQEQGFVKKNLVYIITFIMCNFIWFIIPLEYFVRVIEEAGSFGETVSTLLAIPTFLAYMFNTTIGIYIVGVVVFILLLHIIRNNNEENRAQYITSLIILILYIFVYLRYLNQFDLQIFNHLGFLQ